MQDQNYADSIQQILFELSEDSHQKFLSKIIPDCDNIIGVRILLLRKLSKQILKEDPLLYLQQCKHMYFEEILLKNFIIANLDKDPATVMKNITLQLPYITNWALCDNLCSELKIAKKYPSLFWDFIQQYISSSNTYEIRFAVVMMLTYYVNDEYINDVILKLKGINNENYYVKMAVAWAISICFIKYPCQTMNYLKNEYFDPQTYNMALQKIIDSKQVDIQTKNIIKSMRIRG